MQAKRNLELKYSCNDFSEIRSVLKEIGAHKEIIKKQKDYFFHLPPQLLKNGGRMKMRVEGKNHNLIYYERPNFTQKHNAIADVKILAANKEILDFMLKTFGLLSTVEKQRELWKKENTIFNLDTVKGRGKIFEIELQKTGVLNNKDRKLFEMYKVKLMPYLGEIIKGSNGDIVKKKIPN